MAIDTTTQRSRRALLLGAVGGLAAFASQALGRPLPARAQDEYIQVGHDYTTATSRTRIQNTTTNADVFAAATNGAGIALFGLSDAGVATYSTSGSNYAVYGTSNGTYSGYFNGK
jgi:hypothetical protein